MSEPRAPAGTAHRLFRERLAGEYARFERALEAAAGIFDKFDPPELAFTVACKSGRRVAVVFRPLERAPGARSTGNSNSKAS